MVPLQTGLFIPELQWQSRGKRRISQGVQSYLQSRQLLHLLLLLAVRGAAVVSALQRGGAKVKYNLSILYIV